MTIPILIAPAQAWSSTPSTARGDSKKHISASASASASAFASVLARPEPREPAGGEGRAGQANNDEGTEEDLADHVVPLPELRAHQLAGFTVELRPPPVSAPTLQGLANRLIRAVRVLKTGNTTKIQLELSTERLPRLAVTVQLQNGRLVARLGVVEEGARALLEPALGKLQAAIEARGVSVSSLALTTAASEPGLDSSGGGGGGHHPCQAEEADSEQPSPPVARSRRDRLAPPPRPRAIRLP